MYERHYLRYSLDSGLGYYSDNVSLSATTEMTRAWWNVIAAVLLVAYITPMGEADQRPQSTLEDQVCQGRLRVQFGSKGRRICTDSRWQYLVGHTLQVGLKVFTDCACEPEQAEAMGMYTT